MVIKVKFFGSIRESLGKNDHTIDSADDISTVQDIWQLATDGAPINDNVYCSVNLEHRDLDYAIKDGDEVAFFPPITGG